MRCPCCRQTIDPSAFLVDLDSNRVTYRGRCWQVEPQLAEFLYALREAYPRSVNFDDLSYAVWGLNPPEDAKQSATLRVYASRARKILRDSGAEIMAANKRGVRLFLKIVG